MKDYMLTHSSSNDVEVIGYSNLDFVRCVNIRKLTLNYLFLLSLRSNFIVECKVVYHCYNHCIS